MLDEMQLFVWVVQEGSLTSASARAHLSQPAVSAAIKRLEEQVGARLLHRGRGVAAVASAAGEAFLPHAERALAAVVAARRAVLEIQGLQRGTVRLGAGATACAYLLPAVVTRFRREHAAILLELREGRTDVVLRWLADEAIDVGIITGPVALPAGVVGEHWRDDELVLVGPPASEACDELPFVTFTAGSPTRALLVRHFPEAHIAMELGMIAGVKAHVRAGVGRSLISRAAVQADVENRRMRTIDGPRTPITRELWIVHRGADRLSPAAGAFLASMRLL